MPFFATQIYASVPTTTNAAMATTTNEEPSNLLPGSTETSHSEQLQHTYAACA